MMQDDQYLHFLFRKAQQKKSYERLAYEAVAGTNNLTLVEWKFFFPHFKRELLKGLWRDCDS